jgi:uncharacterized repeat protein (TIGR01451 family)
LVKVVDNQGLTFPELAEVSDFALSIDGTSTTSGTPVTNLDPGSHTIAEVPVTSPFVYDVGTWTCTNGQSGTLGSASFVVNLAGGSNVTCTITNTVRTGDVSPSLTIEKVATESGFDSVGDVIHYTITATNNGNVTLASVTVTDAQVSDLSCTPANGSSLAPGASITCTASHTITQADLDAGSFYNQACVDDGPGAADQACDDVTTPGTQNPLLSITKVATEQSYDSVGDVIHYTILVTNTGNITLTDVTVTDPNVSNLVCTPTTPVALLSPGGTISCTATHTIVQADLDAGHYANTACADDGAGGAAQVCADEDVPADQNPHLTITKTATEQSYDAVGDVIHYTIVATNDGNITLNNVTVTDPDVSNLTCTPANGSTLAPGASLNCTASHTITQADLDAGHYANSACVDDGEGGAEPACDDADVPGDDNPALSIVKGDNDATYDSVGDTITYSIVATNTGNVTLHNVTITDTLAVLGTCTPAIPVTDLAPGATITCSATHVVTQADIDAGSYLNTACVDDGAGGAAQACDDEGTPAIRTPALNVDKSADVQLITSAGQVITYTYVITNEGNVTLTGVTLVDDKLGTITCPKTSLVPGESMTCTATYTVQASDLSNSSLTNVATADSDQTGPDTDTVTIPVRPPTTGNTYPTGKEPCEFANDPTGITSEGPLTLNYKLDGSGKIKNVSPANFFFFGYLTADSTGTQTVTLEQSNDANLPNMLAVGVKVYLADSCESQVTTGPIELNSTASTLEFSFDGVAGVEYIIKVQYKPSPLVGTSFGTGGATYQFSMSLPNGDSDVDAGGTPLVYSGS